MCENLRHAPHFALLSPRLDFFYTQITVTILKAATRSQMLIAVARSLVSDGAIKPEARGMS